MVSRFELIMRLLRASDKKKFPKIKKRVYDVFKESEIERLKESGYYAVKNIEEIARYNYKRLSEEDRKQYKELKKSKKMKDLHELFLKVLEKSHINFRNLPIEIYTIDTNNNDNFFVLEESEDDFEDFFAYGEF